MSSASLTLPVTLAVRKKELRGVVGEEGLVPPALLLRVRVRVRVRVRARARVRVKS